MQRIACSVLVAVVAFSVANATALAGRIICAVCVQNAFNPNCGFVQQNTCSTNSCGTNCDCILWVNSMVDSCQSNMANDCNQGTIQAVCSTGTYMQVCPPLMACNTTCLDVGCNPISLTVYKCTGNYSNPQCMGE